VERDRLRVAAFDELDAYTLYALLRLRAEVFVVEQDCAYLDLDGRDTEPGTRHLWLDRDGEPVAYLRVLAAGDTGGHGNGSTARGGGPGGSEPGDGGTARGGGNGGTARGGGPGGSEPGEPGEPGASSCGGDPGGNGERWIGRVVVAKAARGEGLAGRLMEAALELVGDHPCRLNAQSYLVEFYRRYGFAPAGPEYLEDGIPHTPMVRAASR
jgi:ElaA protein